MSRGLRQRVPLSARLWAKSLLAGTVGACVRAAAFCVRATSRVLRVAEKHGLDLQRAWDVPPSRLDNFKPANQPPPFSAQDFLFVMDARAGKAHSEARSAAPPRASVIIPVFNQVEYTFQCLRSLLREIDFARDEVIVVDNASTDETARVLAHFEGLIRVVTNEENQGFVGACNQGAALARGRFLVFLNNDTEVLPRWLDALIETVEGDESIGAAGSMFLYPDGRVQEAGAFVWRGGKGFHYGWGGSPADRRYNFARDVDYCSGASILVRKDLFDQLGGFDQRYAPAYYEDVDLCFGVRSLGRRVVYQPASKLVHHEGGTAGTDTSTGIKQYQVVNRQKFYDKWREVLEREHLEEDAAAVERAANRKLAAGRPQTIVFDERMLTPERDAGSARLLFILRALARRGHVVFVPASRPTDDADERRLWREGIETAHVAEFARLLREREFAAALFVRPPVAEALMRRVRDLQPRIKLVFDTVDIHFVRSAREAALTGDAETAREAERWRRVEGRLARECDQVWVVTEEDRVALACEAPGARFEIIPTVHPLEGRGKSFSERAGLVFIGNFLHRPNADAVHYFMREIYPLVREAVPSIKLYVVGDHAPPEIVAYASDDVSVTGYVADVAPIFHGCRAFVAPLRFGAGIKGKIGQALAYGLPVVTTPVGAEGMNLRDGHEAIIADGARQFAEGVIRVNQDAELWQRLSDNGYAHVARNFTPEVVEAKIYQAMGRLGELVPLRRSADAPAEP